MFAAHKRAMMDKMEVRCTDYCEELCNTAIRYRQEHPEAHNFTGNLINSIVVGLWRERVPVVAFYSSDKLPRAIQRKMTASKGEYEFFGDWDNANSKYTPGVDTDEGWGENDAKRFFQTYRPEGNNLFDIVVAYTTEYASYIGTTGMANTYISALNTGIRFLQVDG